MPEKGFDQLLLESVDQALSSLGDSAKQSVYFHMEHKFRVQKRDIPKRIGDFAKGLEGIFGVGARFLEIIMMKELHRRVKGPSLQWDRNMQFAFIEYVAAAKDSFVKQKDRT